MPPVAALLVTPLAFVAVTSSRYLFLESRSREREVEIREGRSVEQQFLPEALIGHDLRALPVIEELGRGGMGVVYRGMDPRLKRDVAIKVLPGRALADEKSRKRFRREALALSKLQHPQIAGIFDFDTQDGTDFLVMEFVPGVPLTTYLRRGPLSEGEVVRISSAVAGGLGGGARARRDPSRFETREHHAHEGRRGKGARLRSWRFSSTRLARLARSAKPRG